MTKVVIYSSDDEQVEKEVLVTKSEFLIGRTSRSDVRVSDLSVSSLHARVQVTADGFRITDLGSANKITVAGKRVEVADVADGDPVYLGTRRLVFYRQSSASPDKPADEAPAVEQPSHELGADSDNAIETATIPARSTNTETGEHATGDAGSAVGHRHSVVEKSAGVQEMAQTFALTQGAEKPNGACAWAVVAGPTECVEVVSDRQA